jgi:WD40 repeat protein
MGSKISKRSSQEPNNDLSARVHIPFQFLDTSKMQSSCAPNMIKIFLKPQRDEPRPGYGQTSSLVFLRDENYLLFGSVYFAAFNDLARRLFAEPPGGRTGPGGDNLCLIDLHSGEMHEVLSSSVRDISVSSNNEYAAILIYTGYSHLQLWRCLNKTLHWCPQICEKLEFVDETLQRCTISHATCCSISPNGKWLVLAVCSNFFTIGTKNHLEIYTLNKNKLDKKQMAAIYKTFPNSMSSLEMLIISLEFSSDNEILAAGTFAKWKSSGVYLISTKTWKIIINVTEEMKPFASLIWGVFSPLFTHHQLLSLTKWGCLQKWDTSPLYDDLTQRIESIDSIDKMYVTHDIPNGPEVTSCPRFSSDGNLFAVPLSDGDIIILDPNLFQILWTILCPNFQSELDLSNTPQHLAATSVCFSKSCEYLAVGYSEDVVSVWLLPRMHFTLKHYCRIKIISMCPPKLVHKLPIPEALKQYLLYQL